MIHYRNGDIFDIANACISIGLKPALINPVNCVGVMGAGLAKSFKLKYPLMFAEYNTICQRHQLDVGKLMVYDAQKLFIINFPTKKHWKENSELSYIEAGIIALHKLNTKCKFDIIAMPMIGCGLGQLDWNDVQKIIEKYLSDNNINIIVVKK